MAYKEPSKILVDIIASEMNLSANRVLIYNNKWKLPNTDDIFISISNGPVKPISNRTIHEDRGILGFYEVQELTMRETLSIDIFSKNSSARLRKEEILMALTSTYSQQQQELYGIKISNIPISFLDISAVEGAARLNRYQISFNVFSWRKKEKTVDYFDSFNYQIYANGDKIINGPGISNINFIFKDGTNFIFKDGTNFVFKGVA